MDIGPGTSHKAKIVELYLKGYEFTDIKRNTRHSSGSITRYLKDFARVAALHNEGYSHDQIRMITEHSGRLVRVMRTAIIDLTSLCRGIQGKKPRTRGYRGRCEDARSRTEPGGAIQDDKTETGAGTEGRYKSTH